MRKHVNARPRAELSAKLAAEVGKARQLSVEFLHTELQMAKAFLDLAATTRNAAVSRRNIRNTAKALDAVGRFIERLGPELPQRQLLARCATELRTRLSDTRSRLQSRSWPQQHPAIAVGCQEECGRQILREVDCHGRTQSPRDQRSVP